MSDEIVRVSEVAQLLKVAETCVLAGLLEQELGKRVSLGNTFITFSNGAAESAVALGQGIGALAARELTWDDVASLVDPGQRSRVSKFQPCLSPEIEHGSPARR